MVRLQELYDQILADYVEELIAASQLGCKESGTSFSRRLNRSRSNWHNCCQWNSKPRQACHMPKWLVQQSYMCDD